MRRRSAIPNTFGGRVVQDDGGKIGLPKTLDLLGTQIRGHQELRGMLGKIPDERIVTAPRKHDPEPPLDRKDRLGQDGGRGDAIHIGIGYDKDLLVLRQPL